MSREEKMEIAIRDMLDWIILTPSNQCWGRGLHRTVAQMQDAIKPQSPQGAEPKA